MEGLEDKLRDYKTAISDPRLYDEKVQFLMGKGLPWSGIEHFI